MTARLPAVHMEIESRAIPHIKLQEQNLIFLALQEQDYGFWHRLYLKLLPRQMSYGNNSLFTSPWGFASLPCFDNVDFVKWRPSFIQFFTGPRTIVSWVRWISNTVFSQSVHWASKDSIPLPVHLASMRTSVSRLGKPRAQKHNQKEGFACNASFCLLQKWKWRCLFCNPPWTSELIKLQSLRSSQFGGHEKGS